ncbi:hypothetical protein [Streptomyces otsuchiensis]|uniref:hypothetical protein n=1 Tax=Streptomyces otsuchiensis TaxID=2681388 RepID=UPI0013001BEB|nr:hypothetical protein [Streptomyces otsuchiensis]
MAAPQEFTEPVTGIDAFDLVVGELETELPEGQTTSMFSVGHPGTCSSHYCCIAAV